MDFVDQMIIRLADTAQRAGVFDQTALEQIARAAYDADVMSVTGPYETVFDDVQLGVARSPLGSVEGTWRPVGSSEYTEAQFTVGSMMPPPDGRIDALWRGAIVAQFARLGEPVTAVKVNWPQLGHVDAEIIAAQGALPQDSTALERARRAQLLADLKSDLSEPAVLTDADFDRWLQALGASTVSGLLDGREGVAAGAGMQVTFAPPAAPNASPQPLPVMAAILIRDVAGFSLATLLSESRQARAQIEALGFKLPETEQARLRQPAVVIWIVPATLFADADWPGATTGQTADQQIAARRAAAGGWLAEEGIGLAAV